MSEEDSGSKEEDDYSVLVKAQVMTRDDSSGGWVPLGSGGLSSVGLRMRKQPLHPSTMPCAAATPTHSSFSIYGQRLADRTVVLDCTIDRHLEYTRANPTFHYWRAESRRFGLVFQSSTDALLFESGIRRAIDPDIEGAISVTTTETSSMGGASSSVGGAVSEESIFAQPQVPVLPEGTSRISMLTTSTERRHPSSSSDVITVSSTATVPQASHPRHTAPEATESAPLLQQMTSRSTAQATSVGGTTTARRRPSPRNGRRPGRTMGTARERSVVARQQQQQEEQHQQPAGGGGHSVRSIEDTTSGEETAKSSTNGDHVSSGSNGEGVIGETTQTVGPEYVQFARRAPTVTVTAVQVGHERTSSLSHEYSYASVCTVTQQPTAEQPGSSGIGVTPSTEILPELQPAPVVQPPLPTKASTSARRPRGRWRTSSTPTSVEEEPSTVRPLCVYCSEPFDWTLNRPGSCPDAPDPVSALIDRVACVCCARAIVYHCLETGEPPTVDDGNPCACNGGLTSAGRCRRWTALTLLALVVPCMWCYWPLSLCHRCAVGVGCCGGRHSSTPAA